ncbi:hypothetical protein sscle_08g065750 [Sclerotinia sclerotiorum 1980 UF-70]|uniref:Heterokaryon incompatibility domain-containing protein n=1 Tax=Sclerotinia sclerotiorum (strain ATCC 18683 / 1980 / Ss-1) TaxID=665079 RepID=A0A1D9QA48_SCLS1|nr:hypothetical protein sscle_08g065750 [Sclerotinia sclerotiorum 1980 UF-70]
MLFECSQDPEHSCGVSEGSCIDLKLIDCKSRHIVSKPSSTHYAALSYIWGGTEAALSEDGPDGPRLASRVSLVIEDAIKAALYLGFRYLWVDQYCVEQIDKELQERQIEQMHQVYNSADVTLVAAVGDDANSGLAAVCPSSEVVTEYFRNDTLFPYESRWATSGLSRSLRCIRESVWNTRGWTYQESYVSRRVIIFHGYGIYFECLYVESVLNQFRILGGTGADQGIENGPRMRNFAKYRRGDVMFWLTQSIVEYSQRTLRYQNDTIRAFSAILQDFEGNMSVPFHDEDYRNPYFGFYNYESPWRIVTVQGVPFYERLPPSPIYSSAIPSHLWLPGDRLNTTGLCWHYDHCTGGDNASSRKPNFPSWSWAGWTCPIKWRIPKLRSPYGSRGNQTGTIFHLEDMGFIEKLESSQGLEINEAKQAQHALLCFSSVSFPAEAFLAEDFLVVDPGKQADHMICLYEYIIAWPKEGYLCYSEGLSAVLEGLQQGTHRLVLLNVHFTAYFIEFQAWMLRKCETGKSCYERIGSGYHEIERDTRLTKYLEDLVEDTKLERFNIC